MQPSTTFSAPATRRTFLQSCACGGLAAGVRAEAAPAVGPAPLAVRRQDFLLHPLVDHARARDWQWTMPFANLIIELFMGT